MCGRFDNLLKSTNKKLTRGLLMVEEQYFKDFGSGNSMGGTSAKGAVCSGQNTNEKAGESIAKNSCVLLAGSMGGVSPWPSDPQIESRAYFSWAAGTQERTVLASEGLRRQT